MFEQIADDGAPRFATSPRNDNFCHETLSLYALDVICHVFGLKDFVDQDQATYDLLVRTRLRLAVNDACVLIPLSVQLQKVAVLREDDSPFF